MHTEAIEQLIERKLAQAQKLQSEVTTSSDTAAAREKLYAIQAIRSELEVLIHSLKHSKTELDRIAIVQELIQTADAQTYLEIGVSKGECFEKIHAQKKIGVDIIPPAEKVRTLTKEESTDYFEMPSNDFFAHHAGETLSEGVDVALIDGLHEYKQTYADILNVADHLNDDGFIVVHDCNPRVTEYAQPPAEDNPEPPIPNAPWCGDVWKAIAHLRATRDDLHIFTLDCDYGVGIISKGKPENTLTLDVDKLANAPYRALAKNRSHLINLKDPEYFEEFLKEERRLRA